MKNPGKENSVSTDDGLFDLTDKVIVVTGGSSGLGFRIVQCLVSRGATVVSLSLEPFSEPINCSSAHEMIVDIRSRDKVRSAFSQVVERFGRVDAVFNNAGVAHSARAKDIELESLDNMFQVNVYGSLWVAQIAAEYMKKNKAGGSIVNITSILAERPLKGALAYSMTKAAVAQMTQCLALEWAAQNIRVNAIAPGWFPTKLISDILPPTVEGFLKAQNPMRRLGNSEDLDGIVCLLASDASLYMTGAIIPVDGGHRLQS